LSWIVLCITHVFKLRKALFERLKFIAFQIPIQLDSANDLTAINNEKSWPDLETIKRANLNRF
jgi:hypothetical protein